MTRNYPIYSLLSCIVLLLITASVLASGTAREYWIAAEKGPWDYAPSGVNKIQQAKGLGPWGAQTTYIKYRYIGYTKNFGEKIQQPKWMGILGPQIRAVQGDRIIVHFWNRSDKPLSIHPHGVSYNEKNDGADFDARTEAGIPVKVMPGKKFTYRWRASKASAPGPADPSSIVWAYHSHINAVEEIYDGLIGTIVITKKGKERSRSDPRPRDVDYEFTTMFMVFNEENDAEPGLMHSMNGYIFGNLEGLTVKKGSKVRWHLFAMGTEVDIHTAHWHGQTVLRSGKRTDVIDLLPTSMVSVDMKANSPGTWLYHCHVTDHITAGMIATWKVLR